MNYHIIDEANQIINQIQNNIKDLNIIAVSEYDLSRLKEANEILSSFRSKCHYHS